MKRNSVIFLQTVIALVGATVLGLLLYFPQNEGRNVNATQFEIYFNDPFLVYVYLSSIPFFIALYQGFKLLGYINRPNDESLAQSLKAVQTVKYCAIAIAIATIGALVYIAVSMGGKDDIAGGVAMGIFITFTSVMVASGASVFEKTLQNAITIKSENSSIV